LLLLQTLTRLLLEVLWLPTWWLRPLTWQLLLDACWLKELCVVIEQCVAGLLGRPQ
jgi:hypothetical protein